MSLLRFSKTFEHTQNIKFAKSHKRVDSDCFFWCSRLYRDHHDSECHNCRVAIPFLLHPENEFFFLFRNFFKRFPRYCRNVKVALSAALLTKFLFKEKKLFEINENKSYQLAKQECLTKDASKFLFSCFRISINHNYTIHHANINNNNLQNCSDVTVNVTD